MPNLVRWIAIAAALAGSGVGCGRPVGDEPAPTGGRVARAPVDGPAAAVAAVREGAVVVDVRTAGEFAGGHHPVAKQISVGELDGRIADVERLAGGDKSKPVVVYCRTGNRSGRAKEILERAGFTRVINGVSWGAMQAAGRPPHP